MHAGDAFLAHVCKVSAGDLGAAFQQMARQAVQVVLAPAEVRDGKAERQGGMPRRPMAGNLHKPGHAYGSDGA